MTPSASTLEIARPLRSLQRTGIVIPTCNAHRHWRPLRAALQEQGIVPEQVLILDSSSTDGTQQLARQAGYRLVEISRASFRHGATRQLATGFFPGKDLLLFLTQDAVPCGAHSFELLLDAFDGAGVGAAYGRQIAREGAGLIEQHARMFNYPTTSETRAFASKDTMGFRAAFFSNSFAAYRRCALDEVGGFPTDTIVSEDVTVAARMLLAGWKVAYVAGAVVSHSHPLSLGQEFSRYFDIGVHHGRSQWLLEQFGTAGNEGKAFVRSQFRYLWRNDASLLAEAAVRNASKWVGHRLGLYERWLPLSFKRRISGQRNFWLDEQARSERAAKLIGPRILS